MYPEVENRAVVGGACVGFVVGVVGLTLTADITPIGNQWVDDSVIGLFAAMGVAAASGGVATAFLADADVVGTGINIIVADLLSSLMGIVAVIIGFALTFDGYKILAGLLFIIPWAVPSALLFSTVSIAVALVFGMGTYGVRWWWRESAMGSTS